MRTRSTRSPTRALALAASTVLLCQGIGCGAEPPAAERPQNLIVISIDTLRADHMSLHGYARPTTPRIDAFAGRAATFDRAIAPWPKTVPSMLSMFNSRYPHSTGIMYGSRGQYIPDEELMLAEIASENGLATAAVVSNAVLGSATNFNQGFDSYIETYKEESPFEPEYRNSANSVTAYARLLLRQFDSGSPFFLWVHYVDPHATYEPPAEYAAPFMSDGLYDATELRLNEDTGNFHGGVAGRYWRRNGEQKELGWYVANYDGEIAFTDDQIGLLLDEIEQMGLLENTALMITADHGESLGEHQYFFEHGWFPYNACGWIPWVVYWPDMPNPGSRIAHPSSLLNLVPTVSEIMGWEVEDAELHGKSVVPMIAGEVETVDPNVVIEAGEGGLRWHEFLRAVQDERWKLVYVPSERYQGMMQGTEFELYDVIADPMETRNLADAHPDIVTRLKRELARIISTTGPIKEAPGRQPRYSDEELRSLRSLGYIQ
jgi:arylsulfatase A-like enzyme